MNVKLMDHAMELDSMVQHHQHQKEHLYLQQQMYKPEGSELISTSRDQLVQKSNLMNVKLMDHAMELDSMVQHHQHQKEHLYLQQQMYKPEGSELNLSLEKTQNHRYCLLNAK